MSVSSRGLSEREGPTLPSPPSSGSSSSTSKVPAKSPASGDARFSCALCRKSFDRRDLRDRHRRRCEKSIEKGQSPKKKSCQSCARSKVKCDLQIPACQRCAARHTVCEYPINSTNAALSALHDKNVMNAAASTADAYMTPTLDTQNLDLISDGIAPSVVNDLDGMDWDSGLANDPTTNFWESGPWNQDSTMAFPKPEPYTPVQGFPDLPLPLPMGTLSELGEHGALHTLEEPLSPASSTRSGIDSVSIGFPHNDTRASSLSRGGLEMYPTPSQTGSLKSVGPDHRFSSPFLATSTMAFDPSNGSTTSLAGIEGGSHLPSPPKLADHSPRTQSIGSSPQSIGPAPQSVGLFGPGELMNVICEYPRHMLRPNFSSPFCHHRHLRCAQGGFAEPLAVALCCVSASRQSVESSNPFVASIIDDRRDALVNSFPSKTENLEDAIAILHAMCIYQIETILASRNRKQTKPRSMNKDLYHHFLLKMTRLLCRQHLDILTSKDNSTASWSSWTLAETLRRTVFLVDMVNELSYHTQALDSIYHEPLQDSLLMEMPLPAPESMWRATSEEEWTAARDVSGWTGHGVMTLGTAVDNIERGHSPCANGERSENGQTQQISKLIISGAMYLKRHS